ncbi:hypothetical protein B0H17DRAFT_1296293 [Mycena rosella]|uniref:NAD(P)-binding protein n=1 Tax=Mycena rosella TaxID=1033263 RepID=A0AAD7GFY1_MYCRO|nr:hypothetical protein B0H17DRAFT_1296293 [Mycena rosella]
MSSAPRTILVTGSNQGLGMHTVHKLAATPNVLVFMGGQLEFYGGKLIDASTGSRKLAAAEEALAKFASEIDASSTVVPVQLDITDATSIKNAHAFIASHLKEKSLPGLDVLINNAARLGTFEEVYSVNIVGTAAITEAIRPLLKDGGAILNVSSTLGSLTVHTQRPPPMIYPAYNSSKAALNSLTLLWAIQEEEKKSGIRIVSICPGYNATNLNQYSGTMHPAEGCMIIVQTALEKEGKSGIGMHTVRKFAAAPNVHGKLAAVEEALAKFATDVDASSAVVLVQLDVTDAASIKNAHGFIANHLKEKSLGLDVLINNAGRLVPNFEEVYAVNVFGVTAITEAIRPLLNNGGAILNISSTLASLTWHTQRPPPPLFLAYNSSKSALSSLTLQWAIQEEEKDSGIRVVSICPGYNTTSMTQFDSNGTSPADGCTIIVQTALEKEGKSGVFSTRRVRWLGEDSIRADRGST